MKKRKKEVVKKNGFFLNLLKVVLFVIKIPYYVVNFLFVLFGKINTKTKEVKAERKRKSMNAEYFEFNIVKTISGNYSSWESMILAGESKIGLILGARGTGKSALGIKMLENYYAKSSKKCCAMGFKKEDMPSWIEVVTTITEIKEDAFVLVDEGGVLFGSRDSMTEANKLLSELILISRHKNLGILFISQNSSNLDVNILRQADYLMLKPSSLLQIDFERKKIKELYEQVKNEFEEFKSIKGLTYIYSDMFRGFVANKLPSFWNVNISKSFK